MKYRLLSIIAVSLLSANLSAATLPFELSIKGEEFDVQKKLEISDLGEGKNAINFRFKNKNGVFYEFDLKYKKLPSNRSYPGNLDITIKNAKGEKLGYLFFANNGIAFLKQMGEFGLIIDINGYPTDVKFTFDKSKKGNLYVKDLANERLIQDTLVPKYGFQMIRPVIAPLIQPGLRSQTYQLDHHPYAVNYTLKDVKNGQVQFQYNLLKTKDSQQKLLERIYFNWEKIETLREGMFAGKYFDKEAGTFKLVFYPAMGQTQPDNQ